MGMVVFPTLQTPYPERTSIHHSVILSSVSLFHDDSLAADLHTWEEHCGDLIDEKAPCYLEACIIPGCYRERRRNNSVLTSHLLGDKQSLGGEDCNVTKSA